MISFKDFLMESDDSNDVSEGDVFVSVMATGGGQYVTMYQVLEVKSGMATVKRINYKVIHTDRDGGEVVPDKDNFKKNAKEESYRIKKTSNGPTISVKDVGIRITAHKYTKGKTYNFMRAD